MEPSAHALETIRKLFDSQDFSVLSTQNNGRPYASLVATAVTPDLKQIIFLTPRATRKYENLMENPGVAMLIHNSQNQARDITHAVAITATGTALPLTGTQKQRLLALYLDRHPHLRSFAMDSDTAVVCMAVDTYIMVSQFQTVVEIRMEP